MVVLEQKRVLASGLDWITLCNKEMHCSCNVYFSYQLICFAYRNVSEPVNGPPTNNVAEIQAATKAIKVAQDCGNEL